MKLGMGNRIATALLYVSTSVVLEYASAVWVIISIPYYSDTFWSVCLERSIAYYFSYTLFFIRTIL